MATSSCPSRAASGRGPTVGWPLIAARVRATSLLACDVAPYQRPSLGVGQSRPAAPAFARGLPAAECGICPAAAPVLRPRRPAHWGAPRHPAGSGARSTCRPWACRLVVKLWVPTAAPGMGPGGRFGWCAPRHPASFGALARPVQLPTLDLSARGQTMAADSDCRPRCGPRRPVRVGRSLPSG